VIALMLWFYLTAVMLVVGAEVTALLARERSPESIRRRGEEVAAAQVVDGATHEATRKAGQAVGRPSA
jgi:uncharacterized BrkB/YihY/UPF0761 family membrane protein